jgi:glutamate-5-semialdehyde dehydrogenase
MSLNTAKINEENMSIESQILEICRKAKEASNELATASTDIKNAALIAAADSIAANVSKILEANDKDMAEAENNNTPKAFLDRLKLDENRIQGIEKGLRDIAQLPDPVGREIARWDRPNGLDIARVATPLGVIGVIYESRPNVTADAGALCLKSGNAAILRGGSESFYSSTAILECLQEGLKKAGLSENCIQLIPIKDREAVGVMLRASDYIDVIVPRGGKGLIKRIIDESKIPTFQHLDGNCHTYINKSAEKQKAVDIVTNAKMRRTGICGATESIVIDQEIAESFIPDIVDSLAAKNCEVRGDETSQKIDSRIKPASDEDWDTEYLDAIVALKVVSGIDEAVKFVQTHSSSHTDAIVTEDSSAAERFLNEINSAIVMLNASTQFADGGEFGMGAEIGIATGKMHARGPVGLEQLCTFKYVVRGNGQIRP